jgi:hypothetical protein
MKLIVHAGAFKTATSGLQVYLHSARDRLLSERRILYPQTGARRNFGSLNRHSVSHNLLFHVSKSASDPSGRDKLTETRRALRIEIGESGAETIVVSAEKLSLTKQRDKRLFLALFDDLPVDEFFVVYSLRHFASFVESMTNQDLKNPLKWPVGIADGMDGTGMLRDIDHWRNLVGPANVTSLYFDPIDHHGFCAEMLTALGCDAQDANSLALTADNTSASLNTVHVAGALSKVVHGAEVDRHVRKVILETIAKLEGAWEAPAKAVALPQKLVKNLSLLFASKREEIEASLTPASRVRLDADLRRRSIQVSQTPNVDTPAMLTRNDILELVLATHRSTEVGALIAQYLERAPKKTGRRIEQQNAEVTQVRSS